MMADDSEPVVLETNSVHSIDTLYVAGYINFPPEIRGKFEDAQRRTSTADDLSLRLFKQLFDESDAQTQSRFAAMSTQEAQAYVHDAFKDYRESQQLNAGCTMCVLHIANIPWAVNGWSVRPGFDLTLECPFARLHVRLAKPQETSPNIFLEIGSIACWSTPWRSTVEKCIRLMGALGQSIKPATVSRVDLATHTQAIAVEDLNHANFVCRAESNRIVQKEAFISEMSEALTWDTVPKLIEKFEELMPERFIWCKGHKVHQISFARRGAPNPHARLYVKSTEVARSPEKKSLFTKVWAENGLTHGLPVINVEFELTREFLREKKFTINGHDFVIHTLQDLLDHYDDLRIFLLGNDKTQGWLRMINNDRSRAKNCTIHKSWKMIREGLDTLAEVSAMQRDKDVTPLRTKEATTRLARLAARILRKRGLKISPDDLDLGRYSFGVTEVIELIAEELVEYSELCKMLGQPDIAQLTMIHCARFGVMESFESVA